ncbi:MAG TPA: ComEC/Rec2 family competence protein, partial [Patescibacteria group bacterium]|nr:ComEC/Rec2 family competence protein [Patescibacteria group bacterium]
MRTIRQKLELIDKQLEGRRNTTDLLIDNYPLFFAAFGLILGIIIRDNFFIAMTPAVFAIAVIAILASLSFLKLKSIKVAAIGCIVCFMLLGMVRLGAFRHLPAHHINNITGSQRTLATIRGVIITEPRIDHNSDWQFARFVRTDPSSSFYLRPTEIETVTGWKKIKGLIRVQVDGPVITLKQNDRIQAYCWLDRLKPAGNPGQFDLADYLSLRNIRITAYINGSDAIKRLERKNEFSSPLRMLQNRAMEALGQGLEEDENALVQALILGWRSEIDQQTMLAFRKTGLTHYIALSGTNFAIVMGAFWWVCRIAGLSKPKRAIVCLAATAIFLMLVPPAAPTLRAAVIGILICTSFIFRRKPNTVNSLCLAAVILLLIRPTMLFEAGFQLSFATVLGIALLANPLRFFLREKLPNTENKNLFVRFFHRTSEVIIDLFAVGLAAWLGGVGILLYCFYSITPFATIYTILIFPLISIISILGYSKLIFATIFPTVSVILGYIIAPVSNALIWSVKYFSQNNISEILIGQPPLWLIFFYYSLLFFAILIYMKNQQIKIILCLTGAGIFIFALLTLKFAFLNSDKLQMTILDAGDGQAIAVR